MPVAPTLSDWICAAKRLRRLIVWQGRSKVRRVCHGTRRRRAPGREGSGGPLSDYAFEELWLVVDVKVPGDGGLPEANLQICAPARLTTCVQSGPGRHRHEVQQRGTADHTPVTH